MDIFVYLNFRLMKKVLIYVCVIGGIGLASSCKEEYQFSPEQAKFFTLAERNGPSVNEGFKRSMDYLEGWLKLADSGSIESPLPCVKLPESFLDQGNYLVSSFLSP